jgi:hypothetical protein
MSRQKQIESNRQRRKSVRICFGICFALGVLVTLLGETLAASLREKNIGTVVPALASTASPLGLPKTGSQGPWGNLEYRRIPLENYEEQFPNGPGRSRSQRWVFENYSHQQLAELFNSCDLTDAQKAFLLDTGRWEALADGYAILPTDELILGSSRASRQRIYSILARSAKNEYQSVPFRFPLDGFDEQFADSGLSRERIEMLRELTYTNDGVLCLCVDEALQRSLTTGEYQCLIKTLYTVPTWRVGLIVMPTSDIDGLVKYWGRGGREKTIRPLLQSLARTPNGESINISSLLPPFARLRLYSYPDPENDPLANKEDCFYTALNFFNSQPDPKLADSENATKVLNANYYQVRGSPVFGDLIALRDSTNNNVIHICVYVADDLVFTKNGVGFFNPWVLMRIPEMLAVYASENPPHMLLLRRKDMI